MKGLKCFGLFLVLAITLGLSLNVSSDVSALKHSITAMPLYSGSYNKPNSNQSWYVQYTPHHNGFAIYQTGLDIDTSLTNAPKSFIARSFNDSYCEFQNNSAYFFESGNWIYSSSDGAFYPRYVSNSFGLFDSTDSDYDFSRCNQLIPFGTSPHLPMHWETIPLAHDTFRFFKPYSYNYASYFYTDSAEIDGVYYTGHGFLMSDVIGKSNLYQFTAPTYLSIPIGSIPDLTSDSSDFVEINQGTSLDFSFNMTFPGVYNYNLSDLEQSMDIKLHWSLLDSSYTSHTGSVSCNYTIEEVSGYGLIYDWTCPFTSSYDTYNNYISFGYEITPSTGYSSIWSWTFNDGNTSDVVGGDWGFNSSEISVITDHDSTPGSSIGSASTGGDLSQAPGSVYNEYSEPSADWLTTLTNLFNFSALNPFMPLYAMFNDNSSCANIPIIAGMLHSEQTIYCPWFPSDVRSVLTPVLSIAGTMLLFGFFVRWLSSSSGNMFEDQTTHKWGNTQIGQQKHGKY